MKVKQQHFGSINNNCYLITDETTGKSALVDCTEASDKMYDFIGNADLEYILLTHGHFDHIMGARDVKENTVPRWLFRHPTSLCSPRENCRLPPL